jgi:tRNA (mo5U34)-methyltransferase
MDLTGKRVLDVGAWHGCFSFECERRGAKEVVALSLEDPEAVGFNRLKQVLRSKVRYVKGSTYTMSPEELGTFDVVLFFGVLYHLRYPLLAIDRLRSVCGGDFYVETYVTGNRRYLRRPIGILGKLLGIESALHSTPLWRQYGAFELTTNDQSNWFGPNVAGVIEAFESAGFAIEHTQSWRDRAGFRGKAVAVPERLISQLSYEGCAENINLVRLQNVGSATNSVDR